uniref:TATA box-binding protein-like 1 n=1 Tax=Glossina brevipalpis TaxID=37001 RepID=A0A1A9WPF5_9MUSC
MCLHHTVQSGNLECKEWFMTKYKIPGEQPQRTYINNSNNVDMGTLLENNKNCMKTLTNEGSVVGVGTGGNIIVDSDSNNQLGLTAPSNVVAATHMSNSGVGTNAALGGRLTTGTTNLALPAQAQTILITNSATGNSSLLTYQQYQQLAHQQQQHLLVSQNMASLPIGNLGSTENGGLAVITDNSNHHNVVVGTAATGGTSIKDDFLLATLRPANAGTTANNFQHQLQHKIAGGNGQIVTSTPATGSLLHQQQQNQSRLITTTAPGGTLNARQIPRPAVANNNRTKEVLIHYINSTIIAANAAQHLQDATILTKPIATETTAILPPQQMIRYSAALQQNQKVAQQNANIQQPPQKHTTVINSKTNAIPNNTKSFSNASTTTRAVSPATSSYYITNASTNTMNGHHLTSASNTPSSFTSFSTKTVSKGSSSNALSKTTSITITTDLPAWTITNGDVLNSNSTLRLPPSPTTATITESSTTTGTIKTNDSNQCLTVDRVTSSINSVNISTFSVSTSSENTRFSSAGTAELNTNVAVKTEDPQEAEPEIDIVINNVVCTFSVRCHLNLREIALQGSNVEYRRENGMVTMKLRRPYTTASIWPSGRITCAGATSEDQAKIAARRYARCLEKLGFRVRFHNFRVVNVLGTCSMPWAIKIVNFSEKFKREASYEPELHPGVTYKMRYPKATLKIFSTDSITVTAASVANVQAAIKHMYPLVYEFRKRRSPEELKQMHLKQQLSAGLHDFIELDETVKLNRRRSSLITTAAPLYPNPKRRCTKSSTGEREFKEDDSDGPDDMRVLPMLVKKMTTCKLNVLISKSQPLSAYCLVNP